MSSSQDQTPPSLVFTADPQELIDYWGPRYYFVDASAQLSDGRLIPIFFVRPERIVQELADPRNRVFVEKNLIVIREISVAEMTAAIEYAWRDGWFDPE